ncbi:hypothetical protein MG293_000887 [Ovis ammon polii]|uniref:Uncharacterized protein n=1 Tax=Ovis ammon polii TaxID=230172 RepID=A0AAD4UPF3_OVIAM|nr:hypothetical protein MG293_000887 [Ovis ammon polii]
MSKEWWLRGHRKAKRSYSTFKIRRGGGEEIPLVQGKEQRLRFAGAAVKTYPMSKSLNVLDDNHFGKALWTVAYQAHLSTEFSGQEYWSGLSRSPPGDLPDPGIKTHIFCISFSGRTELLVPPQDAMSSKNHEAKKTPAFEKGEDGQEENLMYMERLISKLASCVHDVTKLSPTSWTAACQAPLSMGFPSVVYIFQYQSNQVYKVLALFVGKALKKGNR